MKQAALLLLFLSLYYAGKAQPAEAEILPSQSFKAIERVALITVGDSKVPIKTFQFGNQADLVCINLHDNENSSVEAAMQVLEEKGGMIIKIENRDQRVIRFRLHGQVYGFDPNRIFSRSGIEQTLRENRRFSEDAVIAVRHFADELLTFIPDSARCVIALHNNTNEGYSVKSYLPGHERAFDAKAVYKDSLQDVDDIVFTTDSLIYEGMSSSGYNAIWQDNLQVKKDGSLSVYFGEMGRRYVNLETEHGKVVQYREMLGKLLEVISKPADQPAGTKADQNP